MPVFKQAGSLSFGHGGLGVLIEAHVGYDDDLIVYEGTANEKDEADKLQYFEFFLVSGQLEYPDEDCA